MIYIIWECLLSTLVLSTLGCFFDSWKPDTICFGAAASQILYYIGQSCENYTVTFLIYHLLLQWLYLLLIITKRHVATGDKDEDIVVCNKNELEAELLVN